jgi:hypothetical protein
MVKYEEGYGSKNAENFMNTRKLWLPVNIYLN